MLISTFLPWLRPWLLQPKKQLNANYETILAVKFPVFFKLQQKNLGDQYIVGHQPKSWMTILPGAYGCCAYVTGYVKVY